MPAPAPATSPLRAVVTGASSGIGEACVRFLRARGWDVVAFARRADRLAEVAERTGAHPVVGDVTSDDDVARLVAEAGARGPVHALLNIAGFGLGVDPVDEAKIDEWRAMYETNVLGTVRVTREFLPLLRASRRGDIVLMTSTAGHDTYVGGSGYVASKHALLGVAKTLRLELVGEPIRVIEIAPGLVHTPEFSLNRYHGDQAGADAVYEGVVDPLTADDVADVVTFAVTRPHHVNIDSLILRPVAQASTYSLWRAPLVPKGVEPAPDADASAR
ncbi:SDR family NAD(P)-dependent oxidoreductase [Cellulosimicrobium cellulans]|uniref:SDR family NAD(P)-dependent oxidoreductase n=1 Tax=Cellulosimicrobium cellulans TaxID=1710 RepID=A0ABX5XG83_CELCE|nr:SDR family NAD(P)-dependent oxidoreductase [Cellulosimicrobium cellulans]